MNTVPSFYAVGNVVVDTIKYIDTYPDRTQLCNVLGLDRSLGGLCCNVAIDMARLDPALDVKAVGFTGADENGAFVREVFARYPSIDTAYLQSRGINTFTDVMTVRDTGERTFFTYKGADGFLTSKCIADLPIKRGDYVHLGYALLLDGMDVPDAEFGTDMARALHMARAAGAVTSMDVVSSRTGDFKGIVPHALRQADIVTINEYEASRITGIPLEGDAAALRYGLPNALQALRKLGASGLIVIHSPEVCAALDADDNLHICGTVNYPDRLIKGSVGAGDAFAAGLLYALMRGLSVPDALRAGNAVAAASLSEPGGTEGVPLFDEALKLYELYGERQ